jgi:hypothetical protein
MQYLVMFLATMKGRPMHYLRGDGRNDIFGCHPDIPAIGIGSGPGVIAPAALLRKAQGAGKADHSGILAKGGENPELICCALLSSVP